MKNKLLGIAMLVLLGYGKVCAQATAKVDTIPPLFDKAGHFKPIAKNRNLYDLTKLLVQKSPGMLKLTQAKPDSALMDSYRKLLLQRINATLNNLENDSLHLEAQYNQLFGAGFYNTYHIVVSNLKKYLDGDTTVKVIDINLPTTSEIINWGSTDLFSVEKDDDRTTPDQQAYALIQKNVYASYLKNRFTNDLNADNTINKLSINSGTYLNDWRKLEAWYKLVQEVKNYIKNGQSNVFSLDASKMSGYMTKLNAIDPTNMSFAKPFENGGSFLKKWLWYTNGIPVMNPLLATSSDQQYPSTEPVVYLTAAKRKLQDSLQKANTLEKFGQTKKYYNSLFLPVQSPQNKDKIYLAEYDASKSYTLLDPIDDQTLDNKLKLWIAIYNVPAETTVFFSSTNDNLVYESKAVIALNDLADQIATVTAIAAPNVGIFNKLSSGLNSPNLPNPRSNINIPTIDNNYKLLADKVISGKQLFDDKDKRITISPATVLTPQAKISSTTIAGQLVPLAQKDSVDKIRLILASYLTTNNDVTFTKIVNEFIRRDAGWFLNYTDKDVFDQTESTMIKRFNDYYKPIYNNIQAAKKLQKLAEDKFEMVDSYLKITVRSLPPDKIKETTDTVPVLRTAIKQLVIPDAPKKVTYSISAKKGTEKTAINKIVVVQPLNIVQSQRFDFSIGIAYTYPSYNVASDSTPLPTSTPGDHFQFVAGAHVYLWKPLNKLHDGAFKYWKERFSAYLGLSVAHALNNYYAGLSWDVVPGVRLIGGWHWYKNQHYQIVNNAVAQEATGIESAGFFTSFNLEPITIGKAIGLFK
jgi:hypothetical protein